MVSEVRTLLWLQGHLLLAMFRSRRAHFWSRLGRSVLLLFVAIASIPLAVLAGVALAAALRGLSLPAAFELALLVNTALLAVWLLLPGIYNSEIVERFALPRLAPYPLHVGSLVTGSLLISLVNLVGPWAGFTILGQVAGFAWHNPGALPLICLAAAATFALLVLGGRVMEDVYDLIASDRRLRGLLAGMLLLPVLLLLLGVLWLQVAASDAAGLMALLRPYLGPPPALAGRPLVARLDLLLLWLRPARLLVWLPTGWATAAMALAAAGRGAAALPFLALTVAADAGLTWLHMGMTGRLLRGGAIGLASERVRSRLLQWRIPGPSGLWVLAAKDWLYVWRGHAVGGVLMSTPIITIALGALLWRLLQFFGAGSPVLRSVPMFAAALVVVSVNWSLSIIAANYFGSVDREGFLLLLLAPASGLHVLLAANGVTFLFGMGESLALLGVLALALQAPAVLLWGIPLAACLHLSTLPAYNLASILGPYRAEFEFNRRSRGGLWTPFAWAIATPPVLILYVATAALRPAGLSWALLLAAAYAVGLYVWTISPLARLLGRHAYDVYDTVMTSG